MTKENFLKNLKKHNPRALDYVFEAYGNLIFKVAYSVLNSRTLSEECVNDVLLKIWNSIESFNREDEKFKNWLIVITKYTAIDILRREQKHDNNISLDIYEKEDCSLEKYLEEQESRKEILNEILKFEDDNKEIFIKRFFLGYSIKDISKITNLSENAISNRIRRGRKKLIEKLKGGFLND